MSISRPHDAALEPPDDGRNQTDRQIDAEIADHLAAAADELTREGELSDRAVQAALTRFGDVAAIKRRCKWIQQGDQFMLRIVTVSAFVVLIACLAGVIVAGFRMQDTIDRLEGTLAAVTDAQKTAADRIEQADAPLTLRGRCYIGDKSKPAVGIDVEIYSLPEVKSIARTKTNDQGEFQSNWLPEGQYFITAPLIEPDQPTPRVSAQYKAQSEPIMVHRSTRNVKAELDVKMFPHGQLSFEISGVPQYVEVKHQRRSNESDPLKILTRARTFIRPELPTLPLDPLKAASGETWPAKGFSAGPLSLYSIPISELDSGRTIRLRVAADRSPTLFPAGNQPLSVELYLEPVGAGGPQNPENFARGAPLHLLTGRGRYAGPLRKIEILPGHRTHIRILPPDDIEQLIRTTAADKLSLGSGEAQIPCKFEVVGTYPIDEPVEVKNPADE